MASSSPQLSSAVVAEKPSVARDIARALGASKRGDGYLHGGGWVITWAVGHLVALPEPGEINPAWKRWRREDLPILPQDWPLKVYPNTADQFQVVQRILNSPKIDKVVCATDAGREGELIFRYIYDAARATKPVERLWISSLTPDAIKKGFRNLSPGAEYDSLADAAKARSRADWLVGMNLSRAYSLDYDGGLSVGRVQTPTLAMLVARELEIRKFKPEDTTRSSRSSRPRPGTTRARISARSTVSASRDCPRTAWRRRGSRREPKPASRGSNPSSGKRRVIQPRRCMT